MSRKTHQVGKFTMSLMRRQSGPGAISWQPAHLKRLSANGRPEVVFWRVRQGLEREEAFGWVGEKLLQVNWCPVPVCVSSHMTQGKCPNTEKVGQDFDKRVSLWLRVLLLNLFRPFQATKFGFLHPLGDTI